MNDLGNSDRPDGLVLEYLFLPCRYFKQGTSPCLFYNQEHNHDETTKHLTPPMQELIFRTWWITQAYEYKISRNTVAVFKLLTIKGQIGSVYIEIGWFLMSA
jgi:hypothetical protein